MFRESDLTISKHLCLGRPLGIFPFITFYITFFIAPLDLHKCPAYCKCLLLINDLAIRLHCYFLFCTPHFHDSSIKYMSQYVSFKYNIGSFSPSPLVTDHVSRDRTGRR